MKKTSWKYLGLLSAVLLVGCTTLPGSAPGLRQNGASYQLQTRFTDMYDFALVHTDGGAIAPQSVSLDQAADVLAGYDVVFLGEAHRHPGNHLAQMEIYQRLYDRNRNLSLSLEQLERDVQPLLDRYLNGDIGEQTLRDEGRAWDNHPTSYRPLVEFSKARGLPVIASEVPVWIVRCIGQQGPEVLDKLTAEQRTWVAQELNIEMDDPAYMQKYMSFLGGSGSHGGDAKTAATHAGPTPQQMNSFAAQVSRDDTMAESIAMHVQDNPGRQVVHLNGSFHSESFLGTVERLRLRMPDLKIAVVNPIQVDDPANPRFDAKDVSTGTFVLMTYPAPADYVSDDEMMAQIMKTMKNRARKSCPL